MKKLQVVVLCAVMMMISAQAISQAQFAVGLKAGPNFATINTKDALGTYENRTGWHAGAFVLIKVTKIGIQPEVIFSKQGAKFSYSGTPDLQSNFSYLNIPVMLKLYTVLGINIQAGPQFGFLVKAVEDRADQFNNYNEEDIKDEMKKSDLSLGLGAGWDLPFGLSIDARYNLGLSKINDQSGSPEQKNQVWQVSVGYKLIKLGK